jgi:leukotriene A-4 hydrolase/aminopeptidase
MARLDPHSFCDDAQPQITTLDWHVTVDFERQVLRGTAALTFAAAGGGPLDLDTRDLRIHAVSTLGGAPVAYVLHAADPVLGARLSLMMPEGTVGVRITYETSPEASALQWLTPRQTQGGVHPFLFSQCQAIHARSVVPLQDTPRVRIRYTAELFVPAALKALMAAAFVSREVRGELAIERWEMPQSIPPYLFAFAVGDLVSRELGPRSRVWAEPGIVEAAAWEFEQADHMLSAAEALFGPYPWDRFDVLNMPPSFPYGGMENPRLTFLTPTLLAGDRSLVNVLAHELAHSWTGNLVSNANAEHFWLNEGFTVYAERRIQEVLEGAEIGALHEALGRRSLDEALADFADRPALTHLRTDLTGVDPDEAYSQVPYEKGFLFLKTLERHLGRPAFDAFLKRYIETFGFQSITTDQFVSFTRGALPGALEAIDADAWIDGPGIPPNAPAADSARLAALTSQGDTPPDTAQAAAWTPAEWQLWLQHLAEAPERVDCAALDARFALTRSTNYEVLVAWLELGVLAGYAPAVDRAAEVVGQVGRMKYLRPLYRALTRTEAGRARAVECFERFAAGYHPIARQVVGGIVRPK